MDVTSVDPESRRPRLLLWTVAIVVLISVGTIALMLLLDDPSADEPAAVTPTADTMTTAPSQADSDCPEFPESPVGVPIVAPAAVWIQRGIVSVPTSAITAGDSVNGPSVLDPQAALSCFAHTPTGAVFAAVSSAADALYPPALIDWARERVVGPGQGELLESALAVSPTATSDGRSGMVRGFRIVDCDKPDRCVVEVAATVTFPDGTTATTAGVASMVWVDDDWYYEAPAVQQAPRFLTSADLATERFVLWTR